MSPEEIANILADAPGFWGATADNLSVVAHDFSPLRLTDCDLFQEGDEADELYLLVEGKIEVHKRGPDGGAHAVAHFEPGVFFGHAWLSPSTHRTATARASGPVVLLRMSREDALRWVGSEDMGAASCLRQALVIALARQLTHATVTTVSLPADRSNP